MHEPLKAGNYYHIYNRGNNRENLFVEDMNYDFFLKKYAKYCYPVFDTFAYCLLKNHFHLFVRVRNQKEVEKLLKEESFEEGTLGRLSNKELNSQLISQQLGHTFNTYTQAFNKKYDRTGSLFDRPFKRKKVNEESYFCNLICYIHQNPQLHGFVSDYRVYPYSSFKTYLTDKKTRINTEEIIKEFGSKEGFLVAHEEMMALKEGFEME